MIEIFVEVENATGLAVVTEDLSRVGTFGDIARLPWTAASERRSRAGVTNEKSATLLLPVRS
jgi:hypothetical protein